jgi:sugar/nucleoside kinase (ribokinase family)
VVAAAGHGGPRLDVVAIGNALVDVLASARDEDLVALDLVKGTMVLVDHQRSESIYASMGPTTEASGGSAANTAAGVASLGGRVAFLGRVADDQLGQAFTHDIRSIGVAFDPTPTAAVPGKAVTGHCLVLVTEDAERTMATHLGVASDFGPVDLHDGHLSSVQVVYLEGYLWEQPSAKAAMREAIEVAHAHDAAVALTVSDPFCVEHHRTEFLELLKGDLEMLFANEEEVMSLFGSPTFEAAVEAVAETGVLGVLTRGAAGSVVVSAPPAQAISSRPASCTGSPTG